ncbi:hypothetical protein MO867_21180 [Microbulbifer sp. OS29]|uniref:Uncharacterized protein n=1 Tax=Microbulbifer okhotskensis TaxID=2926617 RepID=A0A9X2ESV5_9GAMM|nr:hypothetical protein [Microbulbifer okhotskensis]MCO1336845.1 hypothetical protein [Microbulbifer okhotskensis]
MKDGTFAVLAGVQEDKILIHFGRGGQPEELEREAFFSLWDDRVILLAKRSLLPGSKEGVQNSVSAKRFIG